MDFILNSAFASWVQSTNIFLLLFFVYFLSLFQFWQEARDSKKVGNSVFDIWFISTIVMIIWGRIAYLISNWSEFSGFFWFWSPYERYFDQIYLFRAMPWRLFKIWDGGFLFIPMLVAFLLTSYILVIAFKRWRWRDMVMPIVLAGNLMLGATLLLYGVRQYSLQLLDFGVYIILFTVIYFAIKYSLKLIYRDNNFAFLKIIQLINFLFILVNSLLLSNIFFSTELSEIDRVHVFLYIVINIVILISFALDIRGDNGASQVSTKAKQRDIVVNQAIKFPK